MQNYTYHFEIKDLLTQFLQAFDGAVVKRYNSARESGQTIGVRYVYSPKQRVLHDLVNKAQHITLPCVAFYITSISRDNNRVFNKLEGSYAVANSDVSVDDHNLQPVPINIGISVSIMTRFQTDMDQILSNFVPYNDPYFIISWTRDGMPYKEIRTEVLWSGTLSLGYPIDLNNNQPARVTCDTQFTIKGWLFKADSNTIGRIFKIDSNFYTVSEVPGSPSSAATIRDALSGTDYTETITVSARPHISYCDRWLANPGVSGTAILYGDMFEYTTAVYLSGSTTSMFSGVVSARNVNTFGNISSLSALYPSISGVIPASYYIDNNSKLEVNYPAPALSGYFDIIVYNEAGYSVLSKDTYNAYRSIQFPTVSGIAVLPTSAFGIPN